MGPHKKETNLEIFRCCFFSAELGEKSSEKEEGNFTPSLLMSRFLACPGCIDLTNYANFRKGRRRRFPDLIWESFWLGLDLDYSIHGKPT